MFTFISRMKFKKTNFVMNTQEVGGVDLKMIHRKKRIESNILYIYVYSISLIEHGQPKMVTLLFA